MVIHLYKHPQISHLHTLTPPPPPQELAEFAVLLQSGLSVRQALCVNFNVSLSAMLGCAIAIPLGKELTNLMPYVIPFAGGLFLYLALAGIVPHLMVRRFIFK
jgi:zinc transporter 12